MEHVIALYLREIWDKKDWIFQGQHGFRLEFACERQVIAVCQDIAGSLDTGVRIDDIIIDSSKAFDLVLYDRLLKRIGASGVERRIVACIREFLLARTQSVRVIGCLEELEPREWSGG
jgi:hypothetical protein